MIESRRLRHFLAVFELGSIGQAADKLLLTQPALSKSLRSLEDELGARLFDRTPMGVVATVFGEALAMHAKAIEAQLRSAEAAIGALRGKAKGRVTVGIGPSVAPSLMPQATLTSGSLAEMLQKTERSALMERALQAKTMQKIYATAEVVAACEELAS